MDLEKAKGKMAKPIEPKTKKSIIVVLIILSLIFIEIGLSMPVTKNEFIGGSCDFVELYQWEDIDGFFDILFELEPKATIRLAEYNFSKGAFHWRYMDKYIEFNGGDISELRKLNKHYRVVKADGTSDEYPAWFNITYETIGIFPHRWNRVISVQEYVPKIKTTLGRETSLEWIEQ